MSTTEDLPVIAELPGAATSRARRIITLVVRSILPVILALLTGALILVAMGKNPLTFYGGMLEYGLSGNNWQSSLELMSPLLIIAIALIVVFRGQLWNLGYDGQFMLGAVVVTGFGPVLVEQLPLVLAWIVLALAAILAGTIWTIVPAWLKARYGTNEIITTLVMSTIGLGLSNILVKTAFQDPAYAIIQTRTIPLDAMLPSIPGTRIHVGLIVALLVAFAFQYILKQTSFGLRLDVFGSNPKAAGHVGIDSRWMVVILFLISGGLIGLAAAMNMLGTWGYLRADWNPAFGSAILPFVFLARLSPVGSIPFVAFYAILATGGTIAAQEADLSVDFLTVIIALILVFMTITEYVGTKRELGMSYLPDQLVVAIRRPLAALTERRR